MLQKTKQRKFKKFWQEKILWHCFLYKITRRKIYKHMNETPKNIKLLIYSEIYNLVVSGTRIMRVVV